MEWVRHRQACRRLLLEAPLWSPCTRSSVTFANSRSQVSVSLLLNLFSFLILISQSSKISPSFSSFSPGSFWHYRKRALVLCSRLYAVFLRTTSVPFLAPHLIWLVTFAPTFKPVENPQRIATAMSQPCANVTLGGVRNKLGIHPWEELGFTVWMRDRS